MARQPKKKQPGQRRWIPMRRGTMNPRYLATVYPDGLPDGVTVEVWANDVYEATIERWPNGWAYITLKRFDRHAVRDWRHLQSIKNETCGPEREAIEIFPAESRLMDTSNQYHLWVLPEGEQIGVGQSFRETSTPAEIRDFNAQHGGKARQREWQEGLSTGPDVGPDFATKQKIAADGLAKERHRRERT